MPSSWLFYIALLGTPLCFVLGIAGLHRFARRHQVRVGNILSLIVVDLVRKYPAYQCLGGVVGIGAGVASGSAGMGIFCYFSVQPLVALLVVIRRIRVNGRTANTIRRALEEALPNIDYYWASPTGGIALSAKGRMISVVPNPNAPARNFSTQVIRSASASQPALTELRPLGASGISGQELRFEAARANLDAKLVNLRQTGLLLELDDFNAPRVFLQMTFHGAEQWLVLLRQAATGQIVSNGKPLQVPSI